MASTEEEYIYQFRVPDDIIPANGDDMLYITTETYYAEVIPSACTQGYTTWEGESYFAWYPIVYFGVYRVRPNGRLTLVDELSYEDLNHYPIAMGY